MSGVSAISHDVALPAIAELDQLGAARIYRFAPAGHAYFTDPVLREAFREKFAELGGMTPAISKELGWDAPTAHRHMTRDIKPFGQCGACDRHYDRR